MRPRTRCSIGALAVTVLASFLPTATSATPTSATASAPRPAPLYMVGDSLTWWAYPSLRSMFPQRGWSSSLISAGAGREVDYHVATIDNEDGLTAIDNLRDRYGDVQDWVVELGTNDALYSDPATYERKVRMMLDRIGPGRQVMWVNVYLPGVPDRQAAWNAALTHVVAGRRGDVVIFDWASINAAHPEWMEPDLIHHTEAGSVAYAEAIADASRMLLPAQRVNGGPAPALTSHGPASGFVPLTPVRLADSRGGEGPVAGRRVLRVETAETVPAGTTAVAIGLTVVGAATDGFVTAYACDVAEPPTSVVNASAGGAPASASAIVPVGADGAVCIRSSGSADVVVDLLGAFVDGAGAGFDALTPRRIHDSRRTKGSASGTLPAGAVARVPLPAGSTGAIVNLTVDAVAAPGFLTAWPCGTDRPLVSNLTFSVADRQRAATTIVPSGAEGELCVYTSAPAAVIVDLLGVFSSTAPAMFHAAAPVRVLDTRTGLGGWAGRTAPDQRVRVTTSGAPDGAVLVGTLTATDAAGSGYLTAWDGAGDPPPTSTANTVHDATRSTMLVVATTDDRFTLAQGPTGRADLVVDVTGWFSP